MLKHFSRLEAYHIVTLAAWGSRVVQAIAQLVMITFLTKLLDVTEYAAYVLITGLIGWYMLVDFGLGISLQNTISEFRARGENFGHHSILAQILLLGSFGLFCIIMYAFNGLLSMHFLSSIHIEENKYIAFYWATIMMGATAIFSASYKIWYAEGKGHWSNILPAIASMISLGGLYGLSQQDSLEYPLLYALITYLLPLAAFPMIIFIYRFGHSFKDLVWDTTIIKHLIKRGMDFFVFGVLAALVLQIDYLILSQVCSAEEIIAYNVLSKVFGLGFFVYNALLLALWPVIAEKIARREWNDVIGFIKKYIPYGILFIITFTCFLVLIFPYILPLLIQNTHIIIAPMLILIFGLYYMLRVWSDTYAMILQSMNDLKPLWYSVPFQAAISAGAQIYLATLYGIYGIVIGLCLSFILTVAWYLPVKVKTHSKI